MFTQTIAYKLLLSFLVAGLFLQACKSEKKERIIVVPADTVQKMEAPNPYIPYDQSPLDMSFYPQNYPVLKMNGTDSSALLARVIYSRPQRKGRNIFGDDRKSLCQYGKEWRLGANEATEIEFFTSVEIAQKKIPKGKYVIYCIPYQDKWTIVLNTNLYTWGLHMDAEKDIFRTDVPVSLQSPILEDFTMVFEKAGNGAHLVMAWGNVKVILPIFFAT